MLISQTAEYALRAVVHLAAHADRPQTGRQIAQGTRVPLGYLSKVLQSLGRAGFVNAQRGRGGGFVLTRPASEISVLQVINAVDPFQRIRTCPLGLEAHGSKLCRLHRKLDDAFAAIELSFSEATFADLLGAPAAVGPLCATVNRAPPKKLRPR